MAKLVECVANISEGRRPAVVETIADAVRAVPGVTLLDVSSDGSHNRSVLSFLGSPEGVSQAALALAIKAVEQIDLTVHCGEHPRMGAVDVIPFIAMREMSLAETVRLSVDTARRIWEQAKLPVFLYEQSATAPNRANLADVRRGGFEGMAEKVQLPEWEPDFGGRTVHPTAGVVAVGARAPLVAFNINLDTADKKIADSIARVLRRSSGGLDGVKAIGVYLAQRSTAQVSFNMTDITRTPLYRVVEYTRVEAARYGVHITGTELVGLTPMQALCDSAAYYLQLEDYDFQHQVLENHLL